MRRLTFVLLALLGVALLILVPISNSWAVHHYYRGGETTATFPSGGIRAEINGIGMSEDGAVHFEMSGEAAFNLYIVSEENYKKAVRNESFAYVGELSTFNVTSVDITGELSEGSYLFYVESLGEGKVTLYYIDQIYSPGGNVLLLWDMALIIASAVILTSLLTYFVLSKRRIG